MSIGGLGIISYCAGVASVLAVLFFDRRDWVGTGLSVALVFFAAMWWLAWGFGA